MNYFTQLLLISGISPSSIASVYSKYQRLQNPSAWIGSFLWIPIPFFLRITFPTNGLEKSAPNLLLFLGSTLVDGEEKSNLINWVVGCFWFFVPLLTMIKKAFLNGRLPNKKKSMKKTSCGFQPVGLAFQPVGLGAATCCWIYLHSLHCRSGRTFRKLWEASVWNSQWVDGVVGGYRNLVGFLWGGGDSPSQGG